MFPLNDPLLLGLKPESAREKTREQVQEEMRDFARRTTGLQKLPTHLDKFISDFVDGPKRRIVEGTDLLPKGGIFETDRDALYCKCGQLYKSHDDPRVLCSAAQKVFARENFDPFATVGYLSRMERLREQQGGDEE